MVSWLAGRYVTDTLRKIRPFLNDFFNDWSPPYAIAHPHGSIRHTIHVVDVHLCSWSWKQGGWLIYTLLCIYICIFLAKNKVFDQFSHQDILASLSPVSLLANKTCELLLISCLTHCLTISLTISQLNVSQLAVSLLTNQTCELLPLLICLNKFIKP